MTKRSLGIAACCVVLTAAAIAGASAVQLNTHEYLVFHMLVELSSIAVGVAVFLIAWNARRYMANDYLLFLGCSLLFVAILDLVHAMTYAGMDILPGWGANLPTQLWISSRYFLAVTLLVAPIFLRRRLNAPVTLGAMAALTAAVLASVFYWRVFPECFAEVANGTGRLTPFKVHSEYVISLIFALALCLLAVNRRHVAPRVFFFVGGSIVVAILAELAFTGYKSVFGAANAIGHVFKFVSVVMTYFALVQTALREPYELLFRELKAAEEDVRRAKDGLEVRVRQRSDELARTIERLQEEVSERLDMARALQQSRERFFAVISGAPVVIFATDAEGTVTLMEGQTIDAPGIARDGLVGRKIDECFAAVPKLCENIRRALAGESFSSEVAMPGGTMWETRYTPQRDWSGKVVGVTGVATDATKRARAQQAAAEDRRRLLAVFDMLPGYVRVVGRDRRIRLVNERHSELFGGQAIGRLCHEVQRSRQTTCEHCPIDRILDTGRREDWLWTHEDGRSFHVWAYPFDDTDGTPAVLELGVDVTEQRRLERSMFEAGESERRQIGRDLHETLAQNLTAMSFLVKGLASRFRQEHPEGQEAAKRTLDLVQQSISLVRRLSHGLDPVGTHAEGLEAVLRELAESAEKRSALSCGVRCAGGETVPPSVATHLYHIAREAVENAVEHAKASTVEISLETAGREVILKVADDGVGLPPGAAAAGIGMRKMKHRAHSINGTLAILPREGGGTVITCRAPLPGEGKA